MNTFKSLLWYMLATLTYLVVAWIVFIALVPKEVWKR